MKDTAPAYDEQAVMAEIFAEIERLHDYWRTYEPKPRPLVIAPGASPVDRICYTCRGTGLQSDDGTVSFNCRRCGGHGILT